MDVALRVSAGTNRSTVLSVPLLTQLAAMSSSSRRTNLDVTVYAGR
jgi:hypothetical protein